MPSFEGLEGTFDTVVNRYEKMRPGYAPELYQMIFDGVCEGFGIEKDAPIKNKVLKGTFIWRWTAKKIHEADEDSRIDVADRVINLFTGMSAQDSERINNAEKTEVQTREQVIHGILDDMYNSNK